MMELFDQLMRQVAMYPRWLVVTGAVLVAIVVLWIVARLFACALKILFAVTVFALVGGLLVWWLG